MAATEAERKRMKVLERRTDKANPKAADMAELREAFDRMPEWALGEPNPYDRALDSLIGEIAEWRGFSREVLKRQHAEFLRGLGYEEASAVERLLMENVGLAWLLYTDLERQYAEIVLLIVHEEAQAYLERRMPVAQTRYLEALESLARVQALASWVTAAGGTEG